MTHRFWVKTLAFLLCAIALLTVLFSATACIGMASNGCYTSEEKLLHDTLYERQTNKLAYRIISCYLLTGSAEEFASCYNVYYAIQDGAGTLLDGGYAGQATRYEQSFWFVPTDEWGGWMSGLRPEVLQAETGAEPYQITLAVPQTYTVTDEISVLDRLLTVGYASRYGLLAVAATAFALFLGLFIFLMRAAGQTETGLRENPIDRCPFDLYTVFFEGLALLEGLWLSEMASGDWELLLWGAGLCLIDVPLLLAYCMSVATRLKVGGLWHNTLLYRLCRFLWRGVRAAGRALWRLLRTIPLVPRALCVLGALLVWSALLIPMAGTGNEGAAFFWWLIGGNICLFGALYILTALLKVEKGGRRIAEGDVNYRIDTAYMPSALRAHADALNHISDGMSRAVESRLRSERFKTELITNVSHDLKTPLTSLVNYADLMTQLYEREQWQTLPSGETFGEYLSVVNRQAARLKKLTEDLVEASKASTGNLDVNPVRCDLGEMVAQTAGEYKERLAGADLELICSCPDTPCCILADGRHLWRIFDNLMNNIVKYALPGTRVYLSLEEGDGRAEVVFRNISRYPLHLDAKDLTERFVRGDASRHTEGSGLGLSIAQSLTELQGGRMTPVVDGDLFKVTLSFATVPDTGTDD